LVHRRAGVQAHERPVRYLVGNRQEFAFVGKRKQNVHQRFEFVIVDPIVDGVLVDRAPTPARRQKDAPALSRIRAPTSSTRHLIVLFVLVGEPIGKGNPGRQFEALAMLLHRTHMEEIDVDAVLATPVMAERASQAVREVPQRVHAGIDL